MVTRNETETEMSESYHHHHHHHLSLNREGRWGTTDNFATSFLHLSVFSTALWDSANSRPVKKGNPGKEISAAATAGDGTRGLPIMSTALYQLTKQHPRPRE